MNVSSAFVTAVCTRAIRSTSLWRILATSLVCLVALGPLGAEAGGNHERFAAGRILVQTRASVTDAEFTDLVLRHGGHGQHRVKTTRLRVVDVAPGSEEYAVQALALDPGVEFAELDRIVYPETTTANDSYYSSAWHLAMIGAPAAWDTAKGAGVTVAVIDSGVDSTHPDLAGKLVPGWNLYDNNSDTSDVHGHGTMVAGVVAALSNNGMGVTSIAWNASVMPIRVSMTNGSAYISTIASAIIWAADHGADIANASFASLTGSATIRSAANYMRSKGGLVVVAAGNYGVLDSTTNTTAVISVSATTSSDTLTSWSSYGPYVDVSAPGSGIWTTTRGGGYAAVSGTSFSSPATCAVLALMKSANPALTNTQLESLLFSTAKDLGTPGYDQYFGYGRIDAAAAVAAATGGAAPAPDPATDSQSPAVNILSPSAGSSVGNKAGSRMTISLTASDNVGVTLLTLSIDGVLRASTSASSMTAIWSTGGVAAGTHTITATAKDSAGNSATRTVSVTVSSSSRTRRR